MPTRIAAASDKIVNDRSFPGGPIHIGSAGRPNLLMIRIRFDSGADAFDTLTLRGADGTLACLSLAGPAPDGEIICVIDLADPNDAEAVRLLRDPLPSGEFRQLRSFGS